MRWWQELLDLVASGRVVPVLGPELLTTGGPPNASTSGDSQPEGAATSLEVRIATDFARKLEVADTSLRTVRDVANAFLRSGGSIRVLQPRLSMVLCELKDRPPAYDLLGEIDAFKFFISVTPDSLLHDALNRVRYGGKNGTSLLINAKTVRTRDLPANMTQQEGTTVFFPFGQQSAGDFAVTEEDTLELLFQLIERKSTMPNLFSTIKASHLLFIGCNYPDWLTRFWIRALSDNAALRAGREELYVVADRCARADKGLIMFLDRTSIRMFEGDAEEFVRQLHADYQRQNAAKPRPAAPKHVSTHSVFVSYSRSTDHAVAEAINQSLVNAGLETWFDADAIESGRLVNDELARNIESSKVFVPIISRAAVARDDRPYFRFEWTIALQQAMRESPDRPFIHPIFVDDLKKDDQRVPREFWERVGDRLEWATNGQVSTRFIEKLIAQVRLMQLEQRFR
jgi:hypothetical protein